MEILGLPVIDVIIFIWAGVTGFIYYQTWRIAKLLAIDLHIPVERRANPKAKPETPEDPVAHEDRVLEEQIKMNKLYALFANFTALFPLWGMLGTVLSLIGLAGKMSEAGADVEQFFLALTSTAWGIVFAIVYKILDAPISVRVAANDKEVDTLLERNSSARKEQERKYAHEA